MKESAAVLHFVILSLESFALEMKMLFKCILGWFS